MQIKILGSGCKHCVALAENAQAAVAHLGRSDEVVKVTDMADIAKAGVMSTPGLAFDDQVVSTGRVLTAEEIAGLLRARN
ncbi:TM0996/MTH895 family glutaredoxin-like protein [Ottowia beijingensis]|uniref:TM0996/MTH895 family glutaredoxin-like protein n=1 Tax=Ottowia beijingensis TaxID=1207057 RepID=A0A853IPQ9_9BURK|nr:thioredoxin family protein [Ottowia beijingensis]NZA02593.1 TM0996/MTH895 family glutaredoxin-like protein [Ottowia beijingensis]